MPFGNGTTSPKPEADCQHLTMADLIDCVVADHGLSENRKRNMASSLRRFCDLLDFDLVTTPASYSVFREAIAGFSAEAVGITQRRFQNIKSDVSTSLKRYAVPDRVPKRPLSNAWQTVRKRAHDIGLVGRLSGFTSWCNANRITPDAVKDGIIEQYRTYLEYQTFKSSPRQRVRSACFNWNKLLPSCHDLGVQPVTLPLSRRADDPAIAVPPLAPHQSCRVDHRCDVHRE